MAASIEGITLPGNLNDAVGGLSNKETNDILTQGFEKNQLIWLEINKALADKRMEIVNQRKQQEILDQLRITYDFEKGQERTKVGKLREYITVTWEKLLKSKWFEKAADSFKRMINGLNAMSGGILGSLMGLALMAALDPSGNLMASIIDTIVDVLLMLFDMFVKLLPRMIDVLVIAGPRIAKAIVMAFKKLWDAFIAAFSKADGVGKLILLALAFAVVIKIIMFLIPIISAIVSVFSVLGTVLSVMGTIIGFLFSPIGLIILAVGALIAIFVYAYNKSVLFRDAVNAVFSTIGEIIMGIFRPIINFFKNIIDAFRQFFSDVENMSFAEALGRLVWRIIKAFFQFLWDAVVFIFTELPGLLLKLIVNLITWIIMGIGTLLKWVIKGIVAIFMYVPNLLKKLWAWIKGLWNSITSIFSKEGFSGLLKALWDGVVSGLKGIGNFFYDIFAGPIRRIGIFFQDIVDDIRGMWGGGYGLKKGNAVALEIQRQTGVESGGFRNMLAGKALDIKDENNITFVREILANKGKYGEIQDNAEFIKKMGENDQVMKDAVAAWRETQAAYEAGIKSMGMKDRDTALEKYLELMNATLKEGALAGKDEKDKRAFIFTAPNNEKLKRMSKPGTK